MVMRTTSPREAARAGTLGGIFVGAFAGGAAASRKTARMGAAVKLHFDMAGDSTPLVFILLPPLPVRAGGRGRERRAGEVRATPASAARAVRSAAAFPPGRAARAAPAPCRPAGWDWRRDRCWARSAGPPGRARSAAGPRAPAAGARR